MSKNDDITYLGVEQETSEKSQEPLKKSKTPKNKTKFKTKKHSFKLNRTIAASKGIKISKKTVIILLIVLAIIILRPIKFLQDTLEKKRQYYALLQEYEQNTNGIDVNIDLKLNSLWNNIVYVSGEKYYVNCKNTMLLPVDGSVTAHYDFAHLGIDMQAKTYPGTVYAATDGVVYFVGTSSKYKNEILIQHTINGMTLYTYYGNLETIMVTPGQAVSSSTPIATEAGTSENVALTYDGEPHHVHFAVRKSPKESSGLNPLIFAKYR